MLAKNATGFHKDLKRHAGRVYRGLVSSCFELPCHLACIARIKSGTDSRIPSLDLLARIGTAFTRNLLSFEIE